MYVFSLIKLYNIYCSSFCFYFQLEIEGYFVVVFLKFIENILDGYLIKEEYDKFLENRKLLNSLCEQ